MRWCLVLGELEAGTAGSKDFARSHNPSKKSLWLEEGGLYRRLLVQALSLVCGLAQTHTNTRQPSSRTLQSHEWRAFSLFTLQIRLTKGLGGCGYKGVSALSLPFNLSVFSNSSLSHSVDNEPTDLATVRNILHEKLQTTNYKLLTAKGIKWNPGMSISVNMIRTSDSCQLSFWDFCFSDEVVTAFAVAVVLQFNRGALNLWQHWWAGNCNARLQAWSQLHGR